MGKLILLLAVLAGLTGTCGYAQADFDLSQRWFNESIYNPAATGNSFTTNVYLHASRQWVDVNGSPTFGAAGVDTYLSPIHSAIGISASADNIGITSLYNIRVSYAYYLSVGRRSTLSLGLSAALVHRSRNASGAVVIDPADPRLHANNVSDYTSDFDFGAEYMGLFKLGIAVRHLGQSKSLDNIPHYSRSLWAYTSTRLNVLEKVSLEPSASFTSREGISRIEAGMVFYFLKTNEKQAYNNRFWIGGMYRFNDQYSVLAGMHITPRIRIGYAFDHAIGKLGQLSSSGIHEVFFSWSFDRIFYKDQAKCCPSYDSRSYLQSINNRYR